MVTIDLTAEVTELRVQAALLTKIWVGASTIRLSDKWSAVTAIIWADLFPGQDLLADADILFRATDYVRDDPETRYAYLTALELQRRRAETKYRQDEEARIRKGLPDENVDPLLHSPFG